MVDEADRDSRLRADAPYGQALVTVAFQAFDCGVDERLTALLRQLALEAGFARGSLVAVRTGIRRRAAIAAPEVGQNLARGIVPRCARHAARPDEYRAAM